MERLHSFEYILMSEQLEELLLPLHNFECIALKFCNYVEAVASHLTGEDLCCVAVL